MPIDFPLNYSRGLPPGERTYRMKDAAYFTTLFSADIINGFMKLLTDEKCKDVFFVDDSLFDRSRSKKTELLARVFDHCSMKYCFGFRMSPPLAGQTGTPLCRLATVCFLLRRICIPAKFVYVRNKSKRKDWLVIVSTDTALSEEEIIRVYGKRWGIDCNIELH